MIKFLLIPKTNNWPARIGKINTVVINILKYKKDLYFDNNINYDCNIILINNKLMKKINYEFRKKKNSTDVLTFISEIKNKKKKKNKICDIFLSAEMIKKDAKKNNINFYHHLTHLIVHSFLHINGFVHVKIKDFDIMKNIEIKVLEKMNINNPYFYN